MCSTPPEVVGAVGVWVVVIRGGGGVLVAGG